MEENTFMSPHFQESQWKQAAPLIVENKNAGCLEVFYLENKPQAAEGPFLREERKLIDALAERVGDAIELMRVEKELSNYRKNLEEIVEKRTSELTFVNQQLQKEIAERERAEKSLREFEDMRIKEIHHRVKNNLQVVSGLLYLESTNFNHNEVVEAFKQSENRVRSIALIHEKLYQSSDCKNLDFLDYVNELMEYLMHSYDLDNNKVIVNVNVDKIHLEMDRAVPLGIIINELVSNALQHAFNEGQDGVIEIHFAKENSGYSLIVHDSGDFPKEIDFKNTESLGLQLVTNLVSQIDGTIDLNTAEGTTFTIHF
ncbi:two-component sensor histidine kinase [Methanohalophilus euhalobius]|uniref:Two-component sensor histidine kinase n=2 Tax=Methanohalophilus TaxID=2175 RepID=A0A285EPV4_9EURY|nr:sensor histidine kinase [Methanohalophilus euhalobius]ODV49324.1 MAG: signal transduction histidine kinase [Methanohalophilus sp. 2-GBenrich]RSD34632.1 MAG: signal transduction histidine kinase [Methanohalophilus sp.]TCL11090.1 two-component sensor histidine kinase [Methanohalophilus euhalobius]SNY00011.1 Two-component sensor histidine kinase, contains HisKA and HATPase domains [Methanohalophilus euhalobius]